MWTFITDYCAEKNLVLAPKTIRIDFEKAIYAQGHIIYISKHKYNVL